MERATTQKSRNVSIAQKYFHGETDVKDENTKAVTSGMKAGARVNIYECKKSTDSQNSEFQWIKINVSPLSPAGSANLCRAVRGGTCIPGFYDGVQDVK